MTYRALFVGLVVGFLAAVAVPSAEAQATRGNIRTSDISETVRYLNGSPHYLGTIRSSDGGCFTNANTMGIMDGGWNIDGGVEGQFSFPTGANIEVSCQLDARIAVGTTGVSAANKYSAVRLIGQQSAGPYQMGEKYRFGLTLNQDTVSMCAVDGGTSEGCVFQQIK